MTSQQTRFLIAAPLLFAVLLGTLLLTTRIDEKSLHGLIVDINDANAEEILQAVIDEGLTTASTVEEMIATLEFDEVFSKMTADETMEMLYELDLLDHGILPGNLEQKKAQLPNRGVDLSILRPDGILTALATASGGYILKHQLGAPEWENAEAVKNYLRDEFALNPHYLLDVLEPIHLLELFEGRPETSALDPVDRLFGYLWGAATKDINGAEEYWNPSHPNVGFADFIVLRNHEPYPNTAEAVNATSQMPAGHRALHPWNLHFAVTGPDNLPIYLWYYDETQILNRSGALVTVYMPWMDDWEQIITPKIDEFFYEYKQEWIRQFGGDGSDALDSIVFDDETYPSIYELFIYGFGINYNELNITPKMYWDAIQADPRWPALRDKLLQRGIQDFEFFETWFQRQDPRQGIWAQVLQEQRVGAFNRAVYQQVAKHFPNVRFSNYLDRYHNQTVFVGSPWRFQEPHFGVGTHMGTNQQISLYDMFGGTDLTPSGKRVYQDPPSGMFVRSIQGSGGLLTIEFMEGFTGAYLRPGQTIEVGYGCGTGITSTGAFIPFNYTLFNGFYPIIDVLDPKRITIEMDQDRIGSDSYPYTRTASCFGLLSIRIKSTYQGMEANLRNFLSASTSANIPVHPTFAAPDYVEFLGGPDYAFPYYGETMLHTAVLGANDFELWNSTGIDDEGNQWINDLIGEASDMLGYENRNAITNWLMDTHGPYTLTGMDTGGRIVWRMTPHELKYPTHAIISMKPAVIELYSPDLPTVTFAPPNSEIIIPEEPQSDLGYWIVQSKEAGILTTTAEAALRIITGVPPQVVEMAGEETTEITVETGETKTLIFAGFDPLNPPVGRSIQTLPIKLQGIAMPEEWKSFAQFVEYPYNIGTAQGEIYVLQLSPEEDDIGNYAATFVTEEGDPFEVTINVSLAEPVPE